MARTQQMDLGVDDCIAADDAPELTAAMLDNAEYFRGDIFVRPPPSLAFARVPRGHARRGRPKLEAPKEQINIRLDADVLSLLRQNGPGWQTKINELLRTSLGLAKSN